MSADPAERNAPHPEIAFLRSTSTIRARSQMLFDKAVEGGTNFWVDLDRLESVADVVAESTRHRYPSLEVPYHSRWGHFGVGGVDRVATLENRLPADPRARLRAELDLVIVSVLLDAGAGPTWSWREPDTGVRAGRSEGLAIASWELVASGALAADDSPFVVDATSLRSFSAAELGTAFQVSDTNPLVGLKGRAGLLVALGDLVTSRQSFVGDRPGGFGDHLLDTFGAQIQATDVLAAVLDAFGPIWPSRLELHGQPMGDVWHHDALGSGDSDRLIPFHKLSQWLTYSLLEPLMRAGATVTGIDELTGLAEYRNGGLFVDGGVIGLRDETQYRSTHAPDSELIVEWRALTITLLDLVAPLVRSALDAPHLMLPAILEGGTWHAGRELAAAQRADGAPPIRLASDGTVF